MASELLRSRPQRRIIPKGNKKGPPMPSATTRKDAAQQALGRVRTFIQESAGGRTAAYLGDMAAAHNRALAEVSRQRGGTPVIWTILDEDGKATVSELEATYVADRIRELAQTGEIDGPTQQRLLGYLQGVTGNGAGLKFTMTATVVTTGDPGTAERRVRDLARTAQEALPQIMNGGFMVEGDIQVAPVG